MSLHVGFTSLSAVLLVSVRLFLAQLLQSGVLWGLGANSPQQGYNLGGQAVGIQGGLLVGPSCKCLSVMWFGLQVPREA